MGVTVTLPFTLTNGTTADAAQVMADYNAIVAALANSVAESGANSSITSLSGLTTPLTTAEGGTPVYLGGTSGGTANAQTVASVTPTGFTLGQKSIVVFLAGFTNTGAATLAVGATAATNVFKRSYSGPVALTGGEIKSGNLIVAIYDGTQYEIVNDAPAFGVSTDIASSATTDLGTVASHNARITSTTTITSFGSSASVDFPIYMIKFAASLTLTHNGTSLILPGAANITTAANDTAIAQYLGSGNWQVVSYTRASGQPVALSTFPTVQRFTTSGAYTYTPTSGATKARVALTAAGGGGGARDTNNGNNGGDTTFGATGLAAQWTAIHGNGGANNGGTPGAGGTGGANGTGTLIKRITGGGGHAGHTDAGGGTTTYTYPGGSGGANPLGGAGSAVANAAGGNAAANTGGGGAGGGSTSATQTPTGSGGGSGEYVEFWINLVGQGAITGSVGAKGTGGAAGTRAGGDGADGGIWVEEFYN